MYPYIGVFLLVIGGGAFLYGKYNALAAPKIKKSRPLASHPEPTHFQL